MVASFITRALILVLGYAYPAYDCYKTVELNRPEIEHLRFWCQYWILIALMTVFDWMADSFVSWLPMYSEAKLAFIVYLWYPKTKGTTYVYETFFKPYIAKHETDIDRNLLELKTRAGDMAVVYFQKAATYGQTRFFEVLNYVAAQSQAPRARPTQRQHPPPGSRHGASAPPPAVPRQAAATPLTRVPSAPSSQPAQPASRAPPSAAAVQPQTARAPQSPSKSQSQSQDQLSATSISPPTAPPTAKPQGESAPSGNASSGTEASSHAPPAEDDVAADSDTVSVSSEATLAGDETLMEGAIRVTRARLRKRIAGTGPSS